MREEQVTKAILKWLIGHQWSIVCYDFPQSGTGHFLHPNGSTDKNKDTINPDIVAVKDNICLFFEDKDRYYFPDYEKQNKLINDNNYTDAISSLLRDYPVSVIYYGIWFPKSKYSGDAINNQALVDFIVGVDDTKSVSFLYNPKTIAI